MSARGCDGHTKWPLCHKTCHHVNRRLSVTVTATVEEAVKLSSLWGDEFPLSESGYD